MVWAEKSVVHGRHGESNWGDRGFPGDSLESGRSIDDLADRVRVLQINNIYNRSTVIS